MEPEVELGSITEWSGRLRRGALVVVRYAASGENRDSVALMAFWVNREDGGKKNHAVFVKPGESRHITDVVPPARGMIVRVDTQRPTDGGRLEIVHGDDAAASGVAGDVIWSFPVEQ